MRIIELRSALNPDSSGTSPAPGETWVDFESTDADGCRWLTVESGLSEEVVEKLLQPPSTTYWRRFGRGRHLQMRAAVPGDDPLSIVIVEFGIWLEPGRVITVRHGNAPALDRAVGACSAGVGPASSWALILYVLSSGISRVEQNLHALVAAIDELEDEVLVLTGEPPIHRVGELQRQLIYARRFRMPLANMMSFIAAEPKSDITGELRDDFEGIVTAVQQHHELLNLSIERASALQGQIRDQMADSLNTATYRFTWVATVFLPLSFLTGLLGINVAGIPGDHNPEAFWVVCLALLGVAALWGIAVYRMIRPFRQRRDRRDD
jgi:zinc transporter